MNSFYRIKQDLLPSNFILNFNSIFRSYGFSADGKIYHEKPKGEPYGTEFKKNDIIGCGYYFSKNLIFFTYNGKYLGEAFKIS